MSNGAMAMVPAGTTARTDGMGRHELVRHGEAQMQAVASMVRAQVEARYAMAVHRPRDWSDVRVRLLAECKRPAFCEAAIYSVPRGGKSITGPSIKFAEAALRCMTNVLPETRVIVDDDDKRIVQVSVTDLEANITYTHELVVGKTVERRTLRGGENVVGRRTNSQGAEVFIVSATEDEIAMKQNAGVSKALRTLALRMLPGDILDDALDQIGETFRSGGGDPSAVRKKIADKFAELGVRPSQLAEYLGAPLEQASPAQINDLRLLHNGIREGSTTFAQALAEVRDARGEVVAPAATAEAPKAPSQAERMKAATKTKKAEQTPAQAAPAPVQTKPTRATGETWVEDGRRFVQTPFGPAEQPSVPTADAAPEADTRPDFE